MTRDDIQQLIPHRDPFLWLDEVVELTESKIRARKTLSPDLPVFRGHYPNFPVFPGVLQLEAAMQAGAVLIAKTSTIEPGKVPVATRINDVRFRRMVRPGETLDIEVTLTEKLSNAFFLTATVSVGGQVTVRFEFACAAAEATS
jgi:3-hydroxyacyl-[acyl-carrier-protein] dehydratase